MARTPDDLENLGTVRSVFVAVGKEIRRQVGEHEKRLHSGPYGERKENEELKRYQHIPGPRTDRVTAVPHPDGKIPDVDLARMIEQLEAGEGDLGTIARNFGYPETLAEREIRRYKKPYREYVQGLS